MELIVLGHDEVERLLPMEGCIAAMAEALTALARGQAHQPLRSVFRPPDAPGFLGLMPAWRGTFGLKAVCIFPDNPARGLDAHQGVVLLSSGETGQPLAVLDASAVTAIRTAAVSAVATRLLARGQAGDLALVGAGVQARAHVAAMAAVRPLRRIRLAARRPERARAFAASVAAPVPIEIADSVEAAVRDADLIVTATSAREPVVRREWISPGAHINAVGACVPSARELDDATVAAGALFVDRRESTLAESGDYLFPARRGLIGPDHIRAEIGEVLAGLRPGRESEQDITIFKSLGLAIEDLAAAELCLRAARERGLGTRVVFS
ncbi:MAG TPA: ornithine cyclodeaminase family protein [Polyangia bacterium]|nr:ornithine cyclodeaminase family protein [Polyangia bacterium]